MLRVRLAAVSVDVYRTEDGERVIVALTNPDDGKSIAPMFAVRVADLEACCIGCGCSDSAACEGGCSWSVRAVDLIGPGICSSCVAEHLARGGGELAVLPIELVAFEGAS